MRLGDKRSLEGQLHKITRIPVSALRGYPLSQFSFDERVLWAQNRETSREEDLTYSLLGILDISMPVIYGEGKENAFRRLNREWRFQFDELAAKYAVAIYTFDAIQPNDLGFKKGDIIRVTKKTENWWTGTIGTGKGIFPSNYVQMKE